MDKPRYLRRDTSVCAPASVHRLALIVRKFRTSEWPMVSRWSWRSMSMDHCADSMTCYSAAY